MRDLYESFREGGAWMWPLLALAAAGVVMGLRCGFTLIRARANGDVLLALTLRLVSRGRVSTAIRVCGTKTPLSRVLRAGLARAGGAEGEIAFAIELAARRERSALARRAGSLVVLSWIAVSTGCLGTLAGFVRTLSCMTGEGPRAPLIAAAWSEALNCGAFGLIVAGLLVVVQSVLDERTRAVLAELGVAGLALRRSLTETP